MGKKGRGPDVYFDFAPPLCRDDPYVDSYTLTRPGKVTMLDPDAAFKPAGVPKHAVNTLGYEYIEHKDTLKDPKEIKDRFKESLPTNILTNPSKSGGGGVYTAGVLFGFDGRSFPEHTEDDYEAAKKIRVAELASHRSKLPEAAFRSMDHGSDHFHADSSLYRYQVPTHVPRQKKPDTIKRYPHDAAFRPANPMKKGHGLDAMMGNFPAHMPDPFPRGPVRKFPVEGEVKDSFKVGHPRRQHNPMPSVSTMTRNMRAARPSSFARPVR